MSGLQAMKHNIKMQHIFFMWNCSGEYLTASKLITIVNNSIAKGLEVIDSQTAFLFYSPTHFQTTGN